MRHRASALLVALVLGACTSGGSEGAVVLDGRPRVPDEEGVVVAVSRTKIALAGGRTYSVSPRLQSFSSSTLQAVPLVQRRDQYVHLGLEGDTVVWLASISAVVRLGEPSAFHIGKLESLDRDQRRLVFADGTVLRLGDDVDFPPVGRQVTAEIDPDAKRVRRLEVAPA
jgi:hypothetical protein